jgi:outer membrane receptor protein involved in Fe transport
VIGASVEVVGQGLGAYTDGDGRYSVLRIPPGTYEIKVSHVDVEMMLQTKVIQAVVVSVDQTTWLNVELGESAFAAEEVVISAESLPIELNLTSSRSTVKSAQIEALPLQELEDVVNLQAGVVDGHFRGGRLGEVDYQVDGVSVNNAFDNKSTLRIDRSLLQEVQVISGTFDAEYGQAMSGVVNAVLKEGTPEFEWGAEVFFGDFAFSSGSRLIENGFHPAAIRSFQGTISGPLGLPQTVFLLSGRRNVSEGYVEATRLFQPSDSSDFENKIFYPTGDGESVPLATNAAWSGAFKITNTSFSNIKLGYQAIWNDIEAQREDYLYRLNPDGLATQETTSLTHGLDWVQTLSDASFFDINLRHVYFEYQDLVYEDLYDSRYDEAGPPIGDINYEEGAFVQGVDFTRFRQSTNGFVGKGSYVNQVTAAHLLKVGGELRLQEVEFGNPGHLTYTVVEGVESLVRHENDPPDYPGVSEYRPIIAAGFAQDQMEWDDLTLRAGLRLDYFDARSYVPSDPANPANSIEGAPPSYSQPTTAKTALAPRLGLAYPLGGRAALHVAYGHFYQFPPIGEMFSNADYSILEDLQAGGIDYGVMGNPDLEPEHTVQYEIGYKHALTDRLGIDVTTFYKDIRNLLGVEFINTYNDAEYARYTNVDFGDVVGITVAADQRALGPVDLSVDYTWQRANGNSSDPHETATRAEAGEDPRPRLIPFNWDQRHTFNMTVSLNRPGSYAVSAILRATSGQPYTPVIESGFGGALDTNSGRKPTSFLCDLRGELPLVKQSPDLNLFMRIFNLFDTRYVNGMVFQSTGSAEYSRFPEADRVTLADPTRFYPPRRIEFGVRLGSGGI